MFQKVFFHLISAESENPVQDYKTVRTELETYNPELLQKTEYLFLSKTDAVDSKTIEKIQKEFNKMGKTIEPISIISPESLQAVKNLLNEIIKEKTA